MKKCRDLSSTPHPPNNPPPPRATREGTWSEMEKRKIASEFLLAKERGGPRKKRSLSTRLFHRRQKSSAARHARAKVALSMPRIIKRKKERKRHSKKKEGIRMSSHPRNLTLWPKKGGDQRPAGEATQLIEKGGGLYWKRKERLSALPVLQRVRSTKKNASIKPRRKGEKECSSRRKRKDQSRRVSPVRDCPLGQEKGGRQLGSC